MKALARAAPATGPVAAAAVGFREAGRGDLDTLAALYVGLTEAHGRPMAPEAARAKLALMLSAPGARAVLFEMAGEALGYALLVEMGDHMFVRNFAIAEPHRRRGLGAALFARLRAEAMPGRAIRLEVSAPHARAFWEAQGFEAWSTGLRAEAREESRC